MINTSETDRLTVGFCCSFINVATKKSDHRSDHSEYTVFD